MGISKLEKITGVQPRSVYPVFCHLMSKGTNHHKGNLQFLPQHCIKELKTVCISIFNLVRPGLVYCRIDLSYDFVVVKLAELKVSHFILG